LSVYDIHGRAVDRVRTAVAPYTWNASGMPAGIYILKARVAGKTLSKRLFLQK
jgi:hypothetical protein